MNNLITRLLGASAVGLLAHSPQLSAQTSAFTYQGSLTQNGQPANGTYDFMFRLLDAETDGTAAPVIPVNPGVGVTNGLFTTGIDFGEENLNGANLWLEISVRTNGGGAFTTLVPRQLLTSAPYAVKALEATTVPQGTITSAMLADGAVTSAKVAPGAVNQLGSPDGSPLTALQVNTNGLVGIGTSNPAAGLHITHGRQFLNPVVLSVVTDETDGLTNLLWASAIASTDSMIAVVSELESGVTLMSVPGPDSLGLYSQFRNGDGNFTNLSGAASVAMQGNLLAVGAYADAVTLINVSNPSGPMKMAEMKNGLNGWTGLVDPVSLAIYGTTLVIGADSAVTIADISDPSNPLPLAVVRDGLAGFENLYGYNCVALSGNLLAIGSLFDSAVTLVDLSNPTAPQIVSELKDEVGGFLSL